MPRRKVDHDSDARSLRAVEAAWKIHQSQVDWTGKVDAKAAFAFTIEAAAITTTLALTTDGRVFAALDTWWLDAMYWAGLILLAVAAYLAAIVVSPSLRRRRTKRESSTNFIYFGHARFWRPTDLENALIVGDMLPQLTKQIVTMAGIAWKKHIRVQWSFRLAILGALSVTLCAGFRILPPS